VEIRYSLTLDDFFAFERYMAARRQQKVRAQTPPRPRTRPIFWVIIAIFVVFAVVMVVTNTEKKQGGGRPTFEWTPGGVAAVSVLGTLALLMVLGYLVRKSSVRRAYKSAKAKGLVDDMTFSLSPEHFSSSTAVSTTVTAWSQVEHVGETDEHIVILIGEAVGYIIPKRAFNSSADAISFVAMAKQYSEQR
jgi:hypothetical protein